MNKIRTAQTIIATCRLVILLRILAGMYFLGDQILGGLEVVQKLEAEDDELKESVEEFSAEGS
jgi:hypothetical protein